MVRIDKSTELSKNGIESDGNDDNNGNGERNGTGNGNGKKEKAEAILGAAEALLTEAGYEGVSARDIAERAGVNKALVFYYWGSMDALLEAVLERYYARHREALAAAFAGDDAPLYDRVHRVVDAYLDFIEQNRLYPRLVQQQVAGGGRHLELVRRHLATFFGWTVEALEGITPGSGPLSARHFYLTLSGIVINYFTYAPVMGEAWGEDPMSEGALRERRAHVHWVVDRLIDGMVQGDDASDNENRSQRLTADTKQLPERRRNP